VYVCVCVCARARVCVCKCAAFAALATFNAHHLYTCVCMCVQPVAFPGHPANFADTYPIVTRGRDGNPTLIVNTDNEYTYLGRLVVDFDSSGGCCTPHVLVPEQWMTCWTLLIAQASSRLTA
jgi:hypothetical protein